MRSPKVIWEQATLPLLVSDSLIANVHSHSTTFARWRQCACPANTQFLGTHKSTFKMVCVLYQLLLLAVFCGLPLECRFYRLLQQFIHLWPLNRNTNLPVKVNTAVSTVAYFTRISVIGIELLKTEVKKSQNMISGTASHCSNMPMVPSIFVVRFPISVL